MPGTSPQSDVGHGGSVKGPLDHPGAAEDPHSPAPDIEEALGILRVAHEEGRALTAGEEERLILVLTNLGVARENLAEIAKRLARGPSGATEPPTGTE